MASRILGMGDVLTLIEKAEAAFDAEEAAVASEKLRTGDFTLEDFLHQMRQMKKMGPLQNLVAMLPGVPKELRDVEVDERELARVEAIICSMTREERANPSIIDGSRRIRIARGSGTSTQEVNAILKQFKQVSALVKQFAKGGKRGKRMGLPPGLDLGGLG
jgi:signal recognition particle subunit SRP54